MATSKKLTWKVEKRNLSDLKNWKKNPRKITEEQLSKLEERITKRGMHDVLKVDTNGVVLSGNQRRKVLEKLGVKEVYVMIPSRKLTEQEADAIGIESNMNDGEFDFGLLGNFEEELLKEVGFDEELDKIFKQEENEKDDEIPETEQNEFGVVKGDIWQLGRHRIMCGDSTQIFDVEKLMNGNKSQMIHTDPPYNVDYGSSKNPRHKIRSIKNDSMGSEEWESFCKNLYAIFLAFNDGDIYMWGASGPEGMKARLWLIDFGFHWSSTIIWKKQQLVLSPAKYQRMYEPCFYGWKEKSSFSGDRKQVEVWEINRPLNSKLHPTMKPIEVCEKAILNSSKRNDIVLDLFLGSGSTLIACEKTNRICFGMEIDEHYCSVIIKRWQDYTGQKAIKL